MINKSVVRGYVTIPTTLTLKRSISMTIYLYKKTHNVTGLMYLGKTSKDPHKYRGSGKDWIPHIKEHGYNVTTEILKECQTNTELTYWGRYYSEMWNVVESDDWANRIPETGGGALYGNANPSCRPEIKQKKKQTMIERYGVEYASQSDVVKQKVKQTNTERYGVSCIFNDPICRKNSTARTKQKHIDGDYKYIHELPNFTEIYQKGCVAAQSPEASAKRMQSLKDIKHQQGSTNSQYGTRWIHCPALTISKKIKKDDPLPDGWIEGRKIYSRQDSNLR